MRDRALRWGISTAYEDTSGKIVEPPESSLRAILDAMGAEGASPEVDAPILVVTEGKSVAVPFSGALVLEDGNEISVEERWPKSVPLGYHRLEGKGRSMSVVVTPAACKNPTDLRAWGWQVQLHSVRSRASWGFGDLADLAALSRWSSELGAGFVLINPLHSPAPTLHQSPSPYYASSRLFRNLLYLRIEDVPGAAASSREIESLAVAGRALNDERLIDRDEVFRLKSQALTILWARFEGDAAFDRFCSDQGTALHSFATFCALAEEFGASWHTWPPEYREPSSIAVESFAKKSAQRVRFHKWLQWLLDKQFSKAATSSVVIADLAVGFDPGGADAWMWQELIANDISIGAPADEFNMQGQDWGAPPFDPWKLRAACYEPFIQTIRASFRGAGGLRIDHVMGLARLFWVPAGSGPEEGAYVRYPVEDLLGILALESHRAGAFVVGEDLGTVEPGLREQLAARGVLSQRVLLLEPGEPRNYPQRALASVTTHDLPTIAGLWTGSDLSAQRKLGLIPNEESTGAQRQRIADATGLTDEAPMDEVVLRTHSLLAQSPSMLAASLEDITGVDERPNMPGTIAPTNWSLALPVGLEEIRELPLARRIADLLGPTSRPKAIS